MTGLLNGLAFRWDFIISFDYLSLNIVQYYPNFVSKSLSVFLNYFLHTNLFNFPFYFAEKNELSWFENIYNSLNERNVIMYICFLLKHNS